MIIGGAGAGSNITYKSTTGSGTATSIAHQFVGGIDGATVAQTILNNGNVGIGTVTPNAVSILDLTSTTKGFLLPRMTTSQRGAITAVAGLLVYDTDLNAFFGFDGTNWIQL